MNFFFSFLTLYVLFFSGMNTKAIADVQKTDIIVAWTKCFSDIIPDMDSKTVCPKDVLNRCLLTSNKNRHETAKGILFHLWPGTWNGSIPPKRFPWQYYVIFSAESPVRYAQR